MKSAPVPGKLKEQLCRTEAVKKYSQFEKQYATLTTRQRAVVDLLLENPDRLKNVVSVCQEAGYALNKPSKANLVLRAIKGKFGDIFDKCFNIGEFHLAEVLTEAIRAERTVIGYTKIFNPETGKLSKIVPTVLTLGPDHRVRLQSVKLITALGDYHPALKHRHDHYPHKEEGELMSADSIQRLQQRADLAVKPTIIEEDPSGPVN